MSDHKFKITTGISTRDCKVELDGRELAGVCRVSFDLAANSVTLVKLEIMGEVLVEGEFRESAILQMRQINNPNF